MLFLPYFQLNKICPLYRAVNWPWAQLQVEFPPLPKDHTLQAATQPFVWAHTLQCWCCKVAIYSDEWIPQIRLFPDFWISYNFALNSSLSRSKAISALLGMFYLQGFLMFLQFMIFTRNSFVSADRGWSDDAEQCPQGAASLICLVLCKAG